MRMDTHTPETFVSHMVQICIWLCYSMHKITFSQLITTRANEKKNGRDIESVEFESQISKRGKGDGCEHRSYRNRRAIIFQAFHFVNTLCLQSIRVHVQKEAEPMETYCRVFVGFDRHQCQNIHITERSEVNELIIGFRAYTI